MIAIDVQDPGNLGAIVRVAEAGGATGVIAAGASAEPVRLESAARLDGQRACGCRSIATAGCGSRRRRRAAARGCRIVATAFREAAGRVFDADLPRPRGDPDRRRRTRTAADRSSTRADERVTIPMQAPVESLNAAVTAALIVHAKPRRASG